MKILIATKLDKAAGAMLKAAGYEVVQEEGKGLDELVKEHGDAVGLIVRSEKVPAGVMDAMPGLKCIIRAGAGYDNIDYVYARGRGIDVMNTPGANANAVAEEVVAMVLAAYRYVVPGDVTTRAGEWNKKAYMGRELTGKTVGIVGLGNIGRMLVKRLEGFECKVLGYDHFLSKQRARSIGAEAVGLEEMFGRADVVSIHVPGGPGTRRMVDGRLLGMMKDGAVLVNCARYGVVDEDALKELKDGGKKLVYCTDVHPKDAAGEQPSAGVADVMLPHLGANTREANKAAAMQAAREMTAYFAEGDVSCVVNAEVPADLNGVYLRMAEMLGRLCREACGGAGVEDVKRVECTFYNELRWHRKWFTPWIWQGVAADAERGLMPAAAEAAMRAQGVEFAAKEPEDEGVYDDSLGLVLYVGGENDSETKVCGARGMVVDGEPVVSEFAGFGHLYAGLSGHTLVLRYADHPGVIGIVGQELAAAGVNIENIVAPLDRQSGDSLAVVKMDRGVDAELVQRIKEKVGAKVAFAISM